ncbi:helix-turn-helix transcriptional regulator [Actinacidiphila sp. DG2A-62]|uniref:helix-turn-helix transcriptional regulator n=1 Tax=Actinacidiphila sp. DG2A-62 TaxID=3108821 RepID=UPI002DC0497D|nr:helix-turn-helix transcriptional regulator [Actinacidiphila sp. DG2A-62]MEC3997739.1 helix-turn-helix transcriptional regulator [Actinacidiphila sp. DG2A-62]
MTLARAPYRVLPDGCMDLLWCEGELLVAGPDTVAYVASARVGTRYAGLRFAPGSAPRVLGVPAKELRNRRVPLDALWGDGPARRLAERAAEDPAAALDAWAARRVLRMAGEETSGDAARRGERRLPAEIAARLAAGRGVAEVAAAVGLGERQLRRRCEDAFGYGPKTLARVLRLQRALELARGGLPFASVAADAGYADQPHLAREVRALTGLPLSELLTA